MNYPYDTEIMAELQRGQLESARQLLEKSVQQSSSIDASWGLLGQVYALLQQSSQAVAALTRAIELAPNCSAWWFALGDVLLKTQQPDTACKALERALELDPNHAACWFNLGQAAKICGDLSRAISAFEKAIELKPYDVDAHINLGMLHLLVGNYSRGWAEFEWRHHDPRQRWGPPRHYVPPRWDGRPLRGSTIFLHDEQGAGDTIQMFRFVTCVRQTGGRVIVGCRPELKRLLQRHPDVAQIVTDGDALPPFDTHASLFSLPHILNSTLDELPCHCPYLTADDDDLRRWQHALTPKNRLYRVGLTWTGNPRQADNAHRSVPPQLLMDALTQLPNLQLFSLQKSANHPTFVHPKLIDWTAQLRDYADTAALMMNLDLIITVCTSVAHLAGALARPTWVLLWHQSDWRWLINRSDSPWYPTIRLFRQVEPGDWKQPTQLLMHDLAKLVNDPR